MSNLKGKGYGNRGSVFTFKLPSGKIEVYTSNACRYEDVIKKARLPEGTILENSTTFELLDGKNNKVTHVDFIWVAEGASISGKGAVERLLKLKAITEDQATAILNAKTATL